MKDFQMEILQLQRETVFFGGSFYKLWHLNLEGMEENSWNIYENQKKNITGIHYYSYNSSSS